MGTRLGFRLAARELRGLGPRLLFFVVSLSTGVAAVVAVAGLGEATRSAVRGQARELLAADLAVSARRPLPDAVAAVLQASGAEWVEVREMATVAVAEDTGRSRLVELKAVGPGYPYYGVARVEPERPLGELLGAGSVVAAPEALAQLGLEIGDGVRIGGVVFTVAGVLLEEPDRSLGPFTFGPRVLIGVDGLARTDLVSLGSRVSYRALVRVADSGELAGVVERLRALEEAPWLRIETAAEAQPALRDGIARVERYLGLVALLSLLVGGIGVAQTVRSWLAGRLDAVAVLRCLGLTSRDVTVLYLGQTAALGLATSLVGGAAGAAIQLAVPALVGPALPALAVDPWLVGPWLRGIGIGVGVAVLFAAPPLIAVRRVPPVRVLRRAVEPVPLSRVGRALLLLALVAGVAVLALVQTRSPVMAAGFTGGALLTVALLGAGAAVIVRTVARIRLARAPLPLRRGLAGLARPGADTAGAVVALGLGVLVVVAMVLVERRLTAQLDAELPTSAPSLFFVDVQPDQWPELRRLLLGQGASAVESAPVVMARLRSVDGRGPEDGDGGGEAGRERWALTREQRLTYGAELPAGNTVVEGSWWGGGGAREISVEEEYARSIGAGLGSVLTFDVQGVPVELVVSSIRRVEWRTFRINFFLQVEPGVLDSAPQWRLVSAMVPRDAEQGVQDLVAGRFPNVTTIPVRSVLEKVAGVLERLGRGVRLLGGFTVLAGVAILGGAASAASVSRGREVALLKTVGLTRWQVVSSYAVEYALVGLVAGVVGSFGGAVVAWLVTTRGMELPWRLDPGVLAAAVVATVLVATAAGLAASVRALARRPVEVLRVV